tara:strand:- start:4593 stop:6710 length:2118 start_codon:yes stop_codon:yes gene_type:complete
VRTVFVLSALSLLFGSSSDDKVTGRVFDSSSKNPISNVNIYFPKEKVGATTDLNGNFQIEYKFDFPTTMEVAHIGYQTLYQTIDKNSSIDIDLALKKTFIKMDELVVTATRTKKLHKNVPIATEVINKSEIKRSGATNIADLLAQRSGVSLQTSVEGGSVLNLLGLDSRYILILVDGQPINGKFNNRVSLDQIQTYNVDKIEIVKGPSSSLYGSEAMAGVINIITTNELFEKSYDFSVRANNTENNVRNDGFGSGSSYLNFKINQPFKNLNMSLNVNLQEINRDQSIELIEIDLLKKQFLESILSFNVFENHDLSFKVNTYDQSESGKSKLMVTNTKIQRNNLSFSHAFKNYTQTITSSTYKRNYLQNRPWGELERDDLTKESFVEYEGLFTKKIGKTDINSGIEIHSASYSSDRIKDGNQSILNKSIFLQTSFDVVEKFNFIIGIRNDDFSEYSSVINPRIGMMYSIDKNWKLRTAWGKGFRAPSFMERFIDWNHAQFNYSVQGNSQLKPEISNGTTLGVEYTDPSRHQISLMLYHTDFSNLINDYVIQPGLLSYQNIESATFSGLELMHQWKVSNYFNSRVSINWLDNRDEKNNPIPNTMPLSINGNLSYFNDNNVRTTFIVKWVAPYLPQEFDPSKGIFVNADKKLNGYAIIDLTGSKVFYDFINVRFGINNLTNYIDNRFGPFVGRSAFLEFSTNINKGEQ